VFYASATLLSFWSFREVAALNSDRSVTGKTGKSELIELGLGNVWKMKHRWTKVVEEIVGSWNGFYGC